MSRHLYRLLAMGFHRKEIPANTHPSQVQSFRFAASLSHELLTRIETLEDQVRTQVSFLVPLGRDRP